MFGIKKELTHDNVDIHPLSIVKIEPFIKEEVSTTEDDSSPSDQLTVSNHGTSLYECPITNVKLEVVDEASFPKDEGSFGPGCSSHTAALTKCEPDIGPQELQPPVILPCKFEPDEYKPVKTEDIPRDQELVVVKVEEFQQSDKDLLMQNCSEKLPQEIRGTSQRDAKLVKMPSQYAAHTDASKQTKLKTTEMLAHASGVPAPIVPVCATHREETRFAKFNSNAVKPCNNVNSKKTQKSKYIFHMQVHTRVKLYECHSCGKRFTKRANFIAHLRVHSGEKPFECKYCDKRFSGLSNLTSHTRVHTGEKPFGCKSCGKRFSVSSSLKVHKRIHTGEKPFECKSCGKSFRDSSSISRHSRVHTGEKPYECKNCNKKFRVSSALTSHMRVHTI